MIRRNLLSWLAFNYVLVQYTIRQSRHPDGVGEYYGRCFPYLQTWPPTGGYILDGW